MDFNEYQEKTKETWISNDKDLERIIFGLCGEVGEIAEYFKKFYREDFSKNPTIDMTRIRKEAGDVQYYLGMLCNILGMTLDDVATVNLMKLADRKKRDKIRGSGDDR